MNIVKTCTKCGDDKTLEKFGYEKKGKYGRRSVCRECRSKHEKQSSDYRRSHYLANQEHIRQWRKDYYQQNPGKFRQDRLDYYYANKDEHNEYVKKYLKRRRKNDPKFRLSKNMATAIWYSLRNKKSGRWESLVGYSVDDLMRHIESLFSLGMTWDNYGKWHIDHIRPVSSFDYRSAKDLEFLNCWSLSNLQPLWAEDNLKKGARV